PWGLVVNEAMNCGLPVATTDAVGAAAGGLVVHGWTGLVVPERNADALAAALDDLLGDEEKRRLMGAAARERVEAWNFTAAADAVHFPNLWPLLTPSALRAARRGGAAVVLTAHNFRFACPGGMLLRDGLPHEDCIEGSSLRCAFRNPRESALESLAYGLALEI